MTDLDHGTAVPTGTDTGVDGIASKPAAILGPIVGGELPVHLVAWDGSSAGAADQPEVCLTSVDALRRILWSPGELGVSQAYVTGELDVPGSLERALTHLWTVIGQLPRAEGIHRPADRGARSRRPRGDPAPGLP